MTYPLWGGYTLLTLILSACYGISGAVPMPASMALSAARGATIRYTRALLQGEIPLYRGHNPLGGWMVILLLLMLSMQAGTGLFANGDIAIEGPLYPWVSKASSDFLTWIHKLNFNILLILISLH